MTCMYANFLETCVTCNCWIVPWWLIVISYITCMLHKLTWSLNLWCTRSRVMIHMNIACAALACANTLGLVRFFQIEPNPSGIWWADSKPSPHEKCCSVWAGPESKQRRFGSWSPIYSGTPIPVSYPPEPTLRGYATHGHRRREATRRRRRRRQDGGAGGGKTATRVPPLDLRPPACPYRVRLDVATPRRHLCPRSGRVSTPAGIHRSSRNRSASPSRRRVAFRSAVRWICILETRFACSWRTGGQGRHAGLLARAVGVCGSTRLVFFYLFTLAFGFDWLADPCSYQFWYPDLDLELK
jgi:hypothetical protein